MKNLRKSVKGTPTCVYFLRGYCAKASKCTFRHEKPEPEKKKPITKQFIRPKVDVPKPKPIPKNDVLEFVPGQGQHGLTLARARQIFYFKRKYDNLKVIIKIREPFSPAEKLSGDTMGEISAKRKEKSEREEIELLESKLCPYLLQGKCDIKPCPFIHGLQCETCGLYVLIEGHAKQNEKHRKGLAIK